MAYIRPAGNVRISDSWQGHRNRPKPSAEPGTDYAVGVGTAVVAPADGVVQGIKDSTSGAAGRCMMIRTGNDWHRALHLSKIVVRSGEFRKGDIIARSGASAGGSEHGVGAHLHWSFWFDSKKVPTPGFTDTDDFEVFVKTPAFAILGGGIDEEDEMFTDADRVLLKQIKTQLGNVHAGIWAGGRVQIGATVQKFNFGALPIAAQTQELITKQAGEIEALKAVVEQLTAKQNLVIDEAPVNAARLRGIDLANGGFLNAPTRTVDLDQDPEIDPLEGAEDAVPGALGAIDPAAINPVVVDPAPGG